jgi:hypothetical protein
MNMRIVSGVRQMFRDPVEAYHKAVSQWYERNDPDDTPCNYVPDANWRERLGVTGDDRERVNRLCRSIEATLTAKGIRPGPESYLFWNDGDPALLQAIWRLIIRVNAAKVVETGVAHGVTSRIVLEALHQNDLGHLWSIDLPFPFDHRLHSETGAAVTDELRPRWSYLEGASSQRMPPLVAEVGHVEMFIHDSLHTAENTLFEMEQAASAMPAGGVMLVDDIDSHLGFATFAERHPGYQTIICPSADRTGMFGIAVRAALRPA